MTGADYRREIPTRWQIDANSWVHESGERISAWMAWPFGAVTPMVVLACWETREGAGGPCVRCDVPVTGVRRVEGGITLITDCVRVYPDDGWRFAPLAPRSFEFRRWDELEGGR